MTDVKNEQFDNPNDTACDELKSNEEREEEMRYCKYCDYQAPDWPMFAAHVLKPSHVKKFAEAIKVRVQVDPGLLNITCEVCNVTCSGHIPWNAHLMGVKHRKAKQGIDQRKTTPKRTNMHNSKPYDRNIMNQSVTNDEFEAYPEPLIGLEYVSKDEIRGKLVWYSCSICQVHFDSNLKFAHLVGQKHRINVLSVKRPELMHTIKINEKKRSDATQILLIEAQKLEAEEGRQKIVSYIGGGRGNARKSLGAGRGALTSSAVGGTQERKVISQPAPATLDYNQPFGNPYVREPINDGRMW